MSDYIKEKIQEFREEFTEPLGGVMVVKMNPLKLELWLEKALQEAKQEGYTEGSAYKGKVVREAYNRGFWEGQHNENERIQSLLTIGAIPETTEYANGWNDCRKRYFEAKKSLSLSQEQSPEEKDYPKHCGKCTNPGAYINEEHDLKAIEHLGTPDSPKYC